MRHLICLSRLIHRHLLLLFAIESYLQCSNVRRKKTKKQKKKKKKVTATDAAIISSSQARIHVVQLQQQQQWQRTEEEEGGGRSFVVPCRAVPCRFDSIRFDSIRIGEKPLFFPSHLIAAAAFTLPRIVSCVGSGGRKDEKWCGLLDSSTRTEQSRAEQSRAELS